MLTARGAVRDPSKNNLLCDEYNVILFARTVLMSVAVVGAPTGHVTLGANMANGIEQKGIDSLQQCVKKCASAGLGIPATVCTPMYNLSLIHI